jgi:hypothetical protein
LAIGRHVGCWSRRERVDRESRLSGEAVAYVSKMPGTEFSRQQKRRSVARLLSNRAEGRWEVMTYRAFRAFRAAPTERKQDGGLLKIRRMNASCRGRSSGGL